MASHFAEVSDEDVTILVKEGVPQKNQGGDFVHGESF